MTHTKGPWAIDPRPVSNRRVYMPHDVIEIRADTEYGHGLICSMYAHNWPHGKDQGNARLIAEAPTLLSLVEKMREELSQFVKDLGGCDHSVGICECHVVRLCDEADEAVKRIKGETS